LVFVVGVLCGVQNITAALEQKTGHGMNNAGAIKAGEGQGVGRRHHEAIVAGTGIGAK
jgi:hypothetical protein